MMPMGLRGGFPDSRFLVLEHGVQRRQRLDVLQQAERTCGGTAQAHVLVLREHAQHRERARVLEHAECTHGLDADAEVVLAEQREQRDCRVGFADRAEGAHDLRLHRGRGTTQGTFLQMGAGLGALGSCQYA